MKVSLLHMSSIPDGNPFSKCKVNQVDSGSGTLEASHLRSKMFVRLNVNLARLLGKMTRSSSFCARSNLEMTCPGNLPDS